MTALLTTFPLRSTSVPPLPTPALGHSDNEDDKENILLVTILPYNDVLTPWADPEVLCSDLRISWEDHTWQTATYCGLSYEYFSVGPPHAPRFVGLTYRRRRVFGNSKRAIGKLVGQEEGVAFSMSGV
jgi:hypothetical protein